MDAAREAQQVLVGLDGGHGSHLSRGGGILSEIQGKVYDCMTL